ncbi:MAG: cupin-like domain-containing protein [Kiloniellales bacterium]|nr:cupin-like domain-containing protein [Kiloniellales bacterium]
MQNAYLADWSREQAALMEHGILTARHRLHESELFTDEGLIRTIESHPRDALDLVTMGTDQRAQVWCKGDIGDATGEQLLEALRKGHLWINLRRMTWHHPAFAEMVDAVYGELEAICPGFRSFRRSANMLVSSPSALAFYHADAPLNILWHIRGRKRCWVYPPDDPKFMTDELREIVFTPGEVGEELPYDHSFDDNALVYDLEPGDIVTWPQNTPHRIENLEGLNVSVSTEHYTDEARRRQAVFLANHYFRSKLPFPFRSTELYGPGPFLKANAFRVARRLGLVSQVEQNPPLSFKFDFDTPGYVQWYEGAEADVPGPPKAA